MSVKTIRSSNFQGINLDSMIDSLEKVSFNNDTEDYFTRCAQAINLTPDIELKEKKSFSACCGLSFNNVCQKVSCCSVRCFGQDVYNISGYVDESGAIQLHKKATRRELSEDDNKFTNAFFYLKLSKTYGADLPLLLKWTFALLPPLTASYWKTWNMTSIEPLDREKADNLSRTIKKAFDLMTSVRIEMLKDDFVKTFSNFSPLKEPSIEYIHALESTRTIEPTVVTSNCFCDTDRESPILEMARLPNFSREIAPDTESPSPCRAELDVDKAQEVMPEEVSASPSLSRKSSHELIKANPIEEQGLETTQAASFSRETTYATDNGENSIETATVERSVEGFLDGSESKLYKASEIVESSSSSNSSRKFTYELIDGQQVGVIYRSPSYNLAIKVQGGGRMSTKEDLDDIQAEETREQLEPIRTEFSRESTDTVKSLEPISRSPIRGLQKRFQSIARRIMQRSRKLNMSSYDDLNVVRSSIQVEVTPGEKMIRVEGGYIKFNPEIIIRDVRLITGCSRKDAEGIAGAVKERVTDTTTLHDIWGFVKEEIQFSSIEIKIKPDPRFKMLADCEAQTVGNVPIGMVSDLFKNKAFKKNRVSKKANTVI